MIAHFPHLCHCGLCGQSAHHDDPHHDHDARFTSPSELNFVNITHITLEVTVSARIISSVVVTTAVLPSVIISSIVVTTVVITALRELNQLHRF